MRFIEDDRAIRYIFSAMLSNIDCVYQNPRSDNEQFIEASISTTMPRVVQGKQQGKRYYKKAHCCCQIRSNHCQFLYTQFKSFINVSVYRFH